ncbi:Aerobic glycerol-3-phosphate dehydrogenase [BD1-7 clade bacterium]|uniref:Aerobic glycerol-3-phosphate dehydrogenase n=1 Tax=BD1-7 clade bacterium TaxID=2029982 RepID=A0A5S9PA12_9GAMM|nr:Aerobic glycerol-3-phosphate dehydrogenase [BD1-7 clade bacterium]
MEHFDTIIIGAGINGTSIALDAASRGLKTLVIDRQGAGSGTSALIPILTRGFRHMEHYELGLVRRSLKEASIMKQRAPEICRDVPTVIRFASHHSARSERAFSVYRWIAKFTGHPVTCEDHFVDDKGVHLLEQVCDSQTLLYALLEAAKKQQANFRFHHEITSARRSDGKWIVTLTDPQNKVCLISTRTIINASGVGSLKLSEQLFDYHSRCSAEKLKLFFITCQHANDKNEMTVLTEANKRGLLMLPTAAPNIGGQWLVGGLRQKTVDSGEDKLEQNMHRMNELLGRYGMDPISTGQIENSFSVPYVNFMGRSINSTMDHILELICPDGKHPLLNVIGGTSSTSRYLAEQAINSLLDYLPPCQPCKTASIPLPTSQIPSQHTRVD